MNSVNLINLDDEKYLNSLFTMLIDGNRYSLTRDELRGLMLMKNGKPPSIAKKSAPVGLEKSYDIARIGKTVAAMKSREFEADDIKRLAAILGRWDGLIGERTQSALYSMLKELITRIEEKKSKKYFKAKLDIEAFIRKHGKRLKAVDRNISNPK